MMSVGMGGEGLLDCYSDWKTHHEESYVLNDQHPHSPPHEHSINKLVAQKPQ